MHRMDRPGAMTTISSPRAVPGASRRIMLLGAALVTLTIAAASWAIVDLRHSAIEGYRREMSNLGMLLAEQTLRFMQAVDLVVTETRERTLASGVATPEDFKRMMSSEEVNG